MTDRQSARCQKKTESSKSRYSSFYLLDVELIELPFTLAYKIEKMHKVSNVWKLYCGGLFGLALVVNSLDFGMTDEDTSRDYFYRWGTTVQLEVGPHFSMGKSGNLCVAFFYGISIVSSAADANFAEESFNGIYNNVDLTDYTAISRYGVRVNCTL